MIYNEIPTAFLWYDNIKKQHNLQENASSSCSFNLISPHSALLPFEFFKESIAKPIYWEISSPCGGNIITLNTNLSKLKAVQVEGGIYVYYDGSVLNFNTFDNNQISLNIPEGTYQSMIIFDDDQTFFSEFFNVKKDLDKYVKIEFYDNSDIAPIKYNGVDFKQVIYLDTFIHSAEPEIEEDGEFDDKNNIIPTFQKMTVKHRIEVYVPDFIKVALTSLQIHSNVSLESPVQGRIGDISRIEVSSTPDEGVAYSIVSMLIVEEILVKNSCASEIEIININPWG